MAWFERLGWAQDFVWQPEGADVAGFGGVSSEHGMIFLCRDCQGSRGGPEPRFTGDDATGGVWMRWGRRRRPTSTPCTPGHSSSATLELGYLGYVVSMPPTDEPWDVREFHLRHPDGHTFRVGCGL